LALVISQCAPRTCEGGSKLPHSKVLCAIFNVLRHSQLFTASLEFCVILIGVLWLDTALDSARLGVFGRFGCISTIAPPHNSPRCTMQAAAEYASLHDTWQ